MHLTGQWIAWIIYITTEYGGWVNVSSERRQVVSLKCTCHMDVRFAVGLGMILHNELTRDWLIFQAPGTWDQINIPRWRAVVADFSAVCFRCWQVPQTQMYFLTQATSHQRWSSWYRLPTLTLPQASRQIQHGRQSVLVRGSAIYSTLLHQTGENIVFVTTNQPLFFMPLLAVSRRSLAVYLGCPCVIVHSKFVNMILYKSACGHFTRFTTQMHLAQRWTN